MSDRPGYISLAAFCSLLSFGVACFVSPALAKAVPLHAFIHLIPPDQPQLLVLYGRIPSNGLLRANTKRRATFFPAAAIYITLVIVL